MPHVQESGLALPVTSNLVCTLHSTHVIAPDAGHLQSHLPEV